MKHTIFGSQNQHNKPFGKVRVLHSHSCAPRSALTLLDNQLMNQDLRQRSCPPHTPFMQLLPGRQHGFMPTKMPTTSLRSDLYLSVPLICSEIQLPCVVIFYVYNTESNSLGQPMHAGCLSMGSRSKTRRSKFKHCSSRFQCAAKTSNDEELKTEDSQSPAICYPQLQKKNI